MTLATETLGRTAPPPASPLPARAAGAGPLPAADTPQPASDLRDAIARFEGAAASGRDAPPPLATGIVEIDRTLPGGGLARGAVHDVAAGHVLDGAATGFTARLLARLPLDAGPVLWLWAEPGRRRAPVYAHGLPAFGLDPARLIFAAAPPRHLLWAAEEEFATAGLAAVVVEAETIDLTASRRLHLAARERGTTAFLLRPPSARRSPLAAATRWCLVSMPSSPYGSLRWRVALDRCRGGAPFSWLVERADATADFRVVPDAGDLPADADRARLAG